MLKLMFRPVLVAATLFVACLLYYGNAALNFPVLFNLDNHVNYAATRYIAEHHKIPVVAADDDEIYFTELGTTRSLRPPFTFIVSAFVANALEGVVDSRTTRQRLGSPLIAAVTIVVIFLGFWLAFNHVGLALSGSITIGLLPKFVFLASCNNDDIGAILSVSLLFSSVLALIKFRQKNWVLIALAVSVGLVLQTKYTAWLTLPWFGVFCLALLKPVWSKVARLLPLLLLVCIATGGWWVVFNMAHYGVDDPSAMRYATELQRTLVDIEPNRQGYASRGVGWSDLLMNHDQFLSKSYKSLIGYLEWLELDVGKGAYLFYGTVFFVGIIGVAFCSQASLKESAYLDLLILLLIVSQCLFYVHHNMVRDVQPQARYVLPIIMPMLYLFLRVLSQLPNALVTLRVRGSEYGFQAISVVGLIVTSIALHRITLVDYIQPAYAAKPFFTSLKKPKQYRMEDGFKVRSANSLAYVFSDGALTLQRTGVDSPTLVLDPSFCQRLPLNALITLNVSSSFKGGLYLRFDRNNEGRYRSAYWRSFPAGQSVAVFSVNTQNCTGAKITLAKNTHQLTLDNLQISELKIHEHGKPI